MENKLKKVVLLFLLLCTTFLGQSQKRGLAYGHHSPQDLQALSPNISWWYNWSEAPESTLSAVYENYGFEFVPMTWNGNYNETKLREFLTAHPNTKYLLAFNEPNFKEQANMTPSVVAANWGRLEKIASDFNLKIVGPAVNYCGTCVTENGVTYTDPFKYLDDFFAACPTCKVDYIAVHSYMNTVSALSWFVGEFKKYNRPIWLTEFAGWESNGNIKSVNDQINFMIGAVDMLEAEESVFRYSWFVGRGSGIGTYPYIDILGSNGQLTVLGEVYKNMPTHSASQVIQIPGTIEAENYNKMYGILIEKTSDISGFANVGYIESGDWLDYQINVAQSTEYKLDFRVASTKTAQLKLLIDNVQTLILDIPNTNGWQTWTTLSSKINLTQGAHKLRLLSASNGFNINWLKLTDASLSIDNLLQENRAFNIYPNPSNGILAIESNSAIDNLVVFNSLGSKIATLNFSKSIDLSYLPSGIYILLAKTIDGKTLGTKRITIYN